MSDVQISITRETPTVSRVGYNFQLIFGTSGAHDYKEYATLGEVAQDFNEPSPEYLKAKAIFDQEEHNNRIAIVGVAYDTGTDTPITLTDALDDLILEHDDFYFLHCTEQGDVEIEALADWIEGKEKLFFATTDNADFQSSLYSKTVNRTALFYHPTDPHFAERLAGRWGVEEAGSITWKFKTVGGTDPVDIGPGDVQVIHDQHANTYVEKFDRSVTSEGYVLSGEYIDVMRGQDFISMRLNEEVQNLLNTTMKVPMKNQGIAMVVAKVRSVLEEAYDQSIINEDEGGNPDFTVEAPTFAELSDADKQSRTLPNVRFSYTRLGAIHGTRIEGVVSI